MAPLAYDWRAFSKIFYLSIETPFYMDTVPAATQPDEKKKRESTKLFGFDIDDKRLPWFLVKLVLAVWLVMWNIALGYSWLVLDEQESGVVFDAISSLFSGLAFAGIIYTVLLQREELKKQQVQLRLNRKEYRLNRSEMELARKEYAQQNQTLSLQRFENTFFHLLKSFEELKRDAVSEFHSSLTTKFKDVVKDTDKISTWADLYGYTVDIYSHSLTKYFNQLVTILGFVEKQNLLAEEERFYYSLVHAKLNPKEQVVLQLHSRLTYDANHQSIRSYLKKLLRFSGRSQVCEACNWLFENYENPRDNIPWSKHVDVEDIFKNRDNF